MDEAISVAIATPLEPELRTLIEQSVPGVRLLVNDELLPPMRFAGDHEGDPGFHRSAAQQIEFGSLLAEAEVFYGIPDTDPAMLASAVRANPRLRWVQTMAAGGGAQVKSAALTDDELDRVTFTTSAGVHAQTLAEFALFGVLAGAKALPRLRRQQTRREWPQRWPMAQVSDWTVLVVGLGGIGRETGRLLKAVGAKVIGVSRSGSRVDAVDETHSTDELPRLVGGVDAIVWALPGTDETEGLYGKQLIAATKPGATVVNVGRGTVIDEPSLIEALKSGHLACAVLDVFAQEPPSDESQLWTMDQVVMSPHTAALSPQEDRLICELFIDNLGRFANGKELRNVVDPAHFY